MIKKVKTELENKVNDKKLIDNLFLSFQNISEKFITQRPVELIQNTGLFIESVLRVAEHLVFGKHTPLKNKFNIDDCIKKLEKASGFDGLRIHSARLSRAVYDFRSRKKGIHLKDVDPQIIDANLIFNITTWILIEVLKESGIKNPEDTIKLLLTRKIPLVQSVGGILRTTNPKLLGTQRILLILYCAPDGLKEDQLLVSTRQKIKNIDHLKKNLKNMDHNDLIHKLPNSRWALFGQGFNKAEELIQKLT